MIMHRCLKCDELEMIPCTPGVFHRFVCPNCKEIQWIEHSYFTPQTWSVKEFDKYFVIDKASRSVKKQPWYKKQCEDMKPFAKTAATALAKAMDKEMTDLSNNNN